MKASCNMDDQINTHPANQLLVVLSKHRRVYSFIRILLLTALLSLRYLARSRLFCLNAAK